ncbi:MAG: SpoIIE family protein phosphatase [Candidatus Rifleibacteriota bacterium]
MKKKITKFFNQLKTHLSFRKRVPVFAWLIAIPFLLLFFDSPARRIEYLLIDAWERTACKLRTPSDKLAIVGIDSETLAQIKDRWPWPRHHLANLLRKIDSGKPRFIILDILLQHRQSEVYGKGDEILAKTISDLGNIILVSFIENKVLPTGIRKMVFQNHEIFRKNCLFQGLVWAIIDHDGISRSFALEDNDFGLKSAALWIAENSGIKKPIHFISNQTTEKYLISHAKKDGEIPLVTASAIFADNFPADFFKDKIVILGATAPILHDFHNTSRGLMTGPRLLAISIDTLLQRRGAIILQGFAWNLAFIILGLILGWVISFYYIESIFKTILLMPSVFLAGSIISQEFFDIFLPSGSFILTYLLSSLSLLILNRLMNAIENRMLQAEATAAGKVQQQLFPVSPMVLDSHSLGGICIPCSSAGGDFFEMFKHASGKSFFAVADVMGHGIPAALVTSMIKTALTIHRQKTDLSLETLLFELNKVICLTFNRRKMVSGIFGLYDPASCKCELAIAGHPAAYYFRRNKTVEEIGRKSSPLGLLKKPKINFTNLAMVPGEALVIYTDGIVEALSPNGEQYGYERWEKVLTKKVFENENCINHLNGLLDDMLTHAAGQPVDDDLTILMLKIEKKQVTDGQ